MKPSPKANQTSEWFFELVEPRNLRKKHALTQTDTERDPYQKEKPQLELSEL